MTPTTAVTTQTERTLAPLAPMHVVADVDPQLPELCRLRLGEPKTDPRRPGKPLLTFRISSPQRDVLEAIQKVYPGGIVPWKEAPGGPQWQMFSEADTLRVAIPPDEQTAYSSYYEQWGASGCLVRCNGQEAIVAVPPTFKTTEGSGKTRKVVDHDGYFEPRPCSSVCDPTKRDCHLTSRLNVVLLDVEQFGVARLESHSWYFAKEAPGVVRLAARFAKNGLPVPATLSIIRRQTKSPVRGQRDFLVPVLRLGISVTAQMLAPLDTPIEAPRLAAPEAPGPEDEPIAEDEQPVSERPPQIDEDGVIEGETVEPAPVDWRSVKYADAQMDRARYAAALTEFNRVIRGQGAPPPNARELSLGQVADFMTGGGEREQAAQQPALAG